MDSWAASCDWSMDCNEDIVSSTEIPVILLGDPGGLEKALCTLHQPHQPGNISGMHKLMSVSR